MPSGVHPRSDQPAGHPALSTARAAGEVVGVLLDVVWGCDIRFGFRLSPVAYLLAAAARFGRRTALTLPLLPPPQ